VCNGLFATVGLAQKHGEVFEPPLITAGDDLEQLARMVPEGRDSYPVADLISYLLG
jgi:hypothetical protein